MSRGSIGRYLTATLAALTSYSLYKLIKRDRAADRPSDYKNSKPKIIARHIVSIPSVEVRSHPEERKYQEQRSKYNWVQPALFVAAAIAAILSAYTAVETNRQAAAAEEANRPWLRPTALVVEAFGYQKVYDRVYMRATLSFENVGHSPAVRIYPYAEALMDPFEDWNDDYAPKTVCDRATYPRSEYSNVLFPNTSDKMYTSVWRKLSDIRTIYDKAFWSKPGSFDEVRKSLNMKIFGCLLYKDQSKNLRKSAFVLDLGSVDISDSEAKQGRSLSPVDSGSTYVE